MPNNNSLYGSVTNTGSVSSQNYTTLYSSSTAGVANGNLTVDGTLTVNGCAILTNCTSFDLLPTTATTINFGLAATALNLGANTGVTVVNNNLVVDNGLTLSGSTSGSSTFTAPATGSILSYVLPGTQGAANTVLTNDGSGNLTWALPGGGGSQFGNITIGIVTDNTISTTTGDLVITSDTGDVDLTGNLDISGNLEVNDITLLGEIYKPIGGGTLVLNEGGGANEGWEAKLINATTSTVKYPLVVVGEVTGGGTTSNGGGTGIKYSVDLGGDTAIGTTELEVVDLGLARFDYVVKIFDPPGALVEQFRVTNEGNIIVQGDANILDDANVTGTTTSANFVVPVNNTAAAVGLTGTMAGNDYWSIGGYSISGTAGNDGALEIATANNGNEPIYVRQYTGGFVPPGAWPYTNTILRTLTLLGSSGETILPVSLTLNGSSSGSSTFAAPATGSTLSYVLPGTAGAANTVLTNDGSGNLSWALPGGGGSQFGNITVGVVTDNTISTTTGDLDITSTTGVINLDTYTTLTDNRLTTTSVSTVTLDSFAVATYQNATYFINVKDAVTGDIQSTKVDIMHNGTTAYINQYANMTTTADLSTFAATISGGNVLLEITPASTNSTQFTFSRTALRV